MTDEPANVVKLRSGATPPLGRVSAAGKPSIWGHRSFRGLTPRDVSSILSALQRGDVERFFDLCSHMLQHDPHLRSVYETLLRGVVSNELRFDDNEEDSAVVDFCRSSIDGVDRLERTLMHLAHGNGTMCAVVEQEWGRRDGGWRVIKHHLIPGRDTRFADDWVVEVRTYSDDTRGRQKEDWIRTSDEPHRWLVHVPGSVGQPPHLSGILLSCVWPFVLKKWATTYGVQTLERFAQGLLLGTIPENASEETLMALLADLEALIATSTGVVREGTTVESIDTSAASAGDAHRNFIGDFEAQMTKAVLGSTLNVEIGESGGNRAAAESQEKTTVLPRLRSIGNSIAETIREQWLEPELRFNAHKFNGRVPNTPRPHFQLEQDEVPEIDELVVNTGAATIDELRQRAKLEPWGKERGGGRIAKMLSPAAPGSADPVHRSDSGEAEAEAAAGVSLNGAQVASLLEIVNQVGAGLIPRETGIMLMTSAFPITRALAESILGDIGREDGFVPEPRESASGDAPPPFGSSRASRRKSRAHQLRLPTLETSPTSLRYQTQIEAVPFDK